MELRLLVSGSGRATEETLKIDGKYWSLTNPYDLNNMDAIPPYACVSYVWGVNRVQNPFFPSQLMSDRTVPALRAVIQAAASEVCAFWVDAFCVPYCQPARSATLESMGYIYSAADRVVGTLGPECHQALVEMLKHDSLAEEFLTTLDSSAWIDSVWTYQEIVNAQRYFVTSIAPHTPAVEGETFFNRIGYSLRLHGKSHNNHSGFDTRNIWPRLNAFEDLGGDCMVYHAFQRPVLQIMSMLDQRHASEERNKCYAIIGALTANRTGRNDAVGEGLFSLRKKVLSVCEEKGDWGFLYSSTDRDKTEPWMPSLSCEIRSVLPVPVHGKGQYGRRDELGRVWLEKVVVVRNALKKESEVNIAALKSILSELYLQIVIKSEANIDSEKEQVRKILVAGGFTGDGDAIILVHGIFYPQQAVGVDSNMHVDIVLSTGLWWPYGCPGILIRKAETGATYIPGVMVGNTGMGSGVEDFML